MDSPLLQLKTACFANHSRISTHNLRKLRQIGRNLSRVHLIIYRDKRRGFTTLVPVEEYTAQLPKADEYR